MMKWLFPVRNIYTSPSKLSLIAKITHVLVRKCSLIFVNACTFHTIPLLTVVALYPSSTSFSKMFSTDRAFAEGSIHCFCLHPHLYSLILAVILWLSFTGHGFIPFLVLESFPAGGFLALPFSSVLHPLLFLPFLFIFFQFLKEIIVCNANSLTVI